MFDGARINLFFVRTCQPLFSAALIAFVESLVEDDAARNAMCAVVPSPEVPRDWMRMWAVSLANAARWREHPALRAWLMKCRLNGLALMTRGVLPEDTARMALLKQVGAKAGEAAARLPALLEMAVSADIEVQTLQAGALRMRVATQGSGPLVLLCHGFPELWCSWRSQMTALAAAGFRAAAPDMRGYGGTDAPADPAQYTMLHHVGDLVALVQALGEQQAVVVGHDWGAPAAWHAALLRPDVFRAVAGLSVPYVPPGPVDLFTALERQGIMTFYMQYFQTPGVAEAELEADVAASLRRITYSLSGDGRGGVARVLQPGKGFLHNTEDPAVLPAWLDADDLAYATAEFQRTGFRGALNWYRAERLNPELLAPWRGAPIRQPSLFIAGDRDDVMKFPTSAAAMARFDRNLPGLRGSHVLAGAGHWVQRERAA